MTTLRLLLWLRWKLFLRSGTTGSRIGGAALTLLMLVAFSPAWLGGALAAYWGVLHEGVPAIVLAFGLCQLAWLSLGLLSGALGRSFDLDKFLRYPVRPRTVFAINLGASLLSPVPLMTLPTLAAVALAAGERSGALAALGVAAGGLGALLITAAFLQVLLALLDEALRRESVRYVATAGMTLALVGMQFGTRWFAHRVSQDVLVRFQSHAITGQQALAIASSFFAHIPTVAAPAAIAAGALDGAPLRVLAGLAGTLALLACGVLPGAALMRHTVRGGESVAAKPARTGRRGGTGSFAFGTGLLPRGIGLMLGRELRLTLRNPQRLMSVFLAPLVSLMFFFNTRGNPTAGAGFTLAMLASTMGTASQLLFAYDGPGVRSFFLLPCSPRDVLLAKNLELLVRLLLQLLLAFGTLTFLVHGLWSPLTFTMLLGAIVLALLSLATGTTISLRHPTKMRQRGIAMRGNTGWAGAAVSFAIFAGAGVLGGVLFGARWLTQRAFPAHSASGLAAANTVGLALAALLLAAAGAIWWRSLELNARALPACRERLIEVLARSSDD